jgi:hypothetical protein
MYVHNLVSLFSTIYTRLAFSTVLLNDLVPENMTLPPPVQFTQTATAKAVNSSLKLTRHMPLTRKSPMALLLASKGSMDWEKSVRARKDAPADDTPVGWRILENDERVSIAGATQPKKPGGLLSFLNRRVSSVPPTDAKVENQRSPPVSTRSSVEITNSPVPERRDASPARNSVMVTPSSPLASSFTTPDIVVPAVTPAPSAVSRFLNRFSRAKGNGSDRKSLALSTDDLEFLSDIVPSAYDPYGDNDDPQLKALSNMINSNSTSTNSTPLPPKLPPPLAPPPKPPSVNTSRPPSVAGFSGLSIALEPVRGSPHPAPARTLSLPPPLSPATVTSFSRPHSPAVPPKHSPSPSPVRAAFPVYSNPSTPAAIPRISSPPRPPSRTHSPFQLLPPPKATSILSIPPLLPPPPVSPQTPRPTVATSSTPSNPGWTNSTWSTATYHDDGDDEDDSFSAFSSLPRRTTFPEPRESLDSSLGSPSSAQALNSSKSATSMSFDDFDDFVTSTSFSPSPSQSQSQIRTPSPPPVPAKPSSVLRGREAGGMTSSGSGSSIHQRTQSLLEHAEKQRGRWPSPSPSFVRPTLSPLPSAFGSFGKDVDLLGDGDGDVLSTQSFGPPPPKGQSAAPLAPLVTQQPLSLSFASLSPSSSVRAPRPPAEPVQKQKGGLTAQDLSFFEGL